MCEESTIPQSNLESGTKILQNSITAIKDLSETYKKSSLTGFLVVSGVVLALLTIVLSFISGTQPEKNWITGITLWEEVIFSIISIVCIVSGTLFLTHINKCKLELQKIAIQIDKERNGYIHRETVAKFNLEGSNNIVESTERRTDDFKYN